MKTKNAELNSIVYSLFQYSCTNFALMDSFGVTSLATSANIITSAYSKIENQAAFMPYAVAYQKRVDDLNAIVIFCEKRNRVLAMAILEKNKSKMTLWVDEEIRIQLAKRITRECYDRQITFMLNYTTKDVVKNLFNFAFCSCGRDDKLENAHAPDLTETDEVSSECPGVDVEIDVPNQDLFRLMQLAHEKDITLNQLVNQIIADSCKNYTLDND